MKNNSNNSKSSEKIQLFRKRTFREYMLYTLVISIGVILDQITKLLATKFLMTVETVPIIKGVLHLTYVENTGAAFGSFKENRWVFMTTSTIMLIGLLLYLYLGHAETKLAAVAVAVVTAGGLGNMIDRTFFGFVVDFIDFRLINFAVFNVADSFVCVGAGLLLLALILGIIDEAKKKAQEKESSGDSNKDEEKSRE